MSTIEIPLKPRPLSQLCTLAGVQYKLTLTWCSPAAVWMLRIGNSLGDAIVDCIPLVAARDLLEPYGYLNFGGRLYATTDHSPNTPPTFENLGRDGRLYFVED